jgi:hypothetical protein
MINLRNTLSGLMISPKVLSTCTSSNLIRMDTISIRFDVRGSIASTNIEI